MNKSRSWMYSPLKSSNDKPSDYEKKRVEEYFQPIVETFKKQYIKKNPNKEFDYLVDIYSKWFQNNFYLCEKRKSEHPNRLFDEREEKFVRLKFKGKNLYDIAYFRHTGQWYPVAINLSLDDCKEIILSNPVFHPIG